MLKHDKIISNRMLKHANIILDNAEHAKIILNSD